MIPTPRQRLHAGSLVAIGLSLTGCSPDTASIEPGVTGAFEPAPVLAPHPSRSLDILVIGGSSGIGRAVVELGLARGHSMTAMARRPERLALTHERLRIVAGDILVLESLVAALAGQDAVVVTVSAKPGFARVNLFSDGMRNVLQAAAVSGLTRVLAVTGIGAGESRGHGGFFHDRIALALYLRAMYEDKDREEALIRQSALDWTILRPGFLDDGPAQGRYRVFTELDGVTAGSLSRADVAHFIVAELEAPRYRRQTLLLSN